MKFTGIIPARYASTRFPGKPLAMLGDRTVIEHVYTQVSKALSHVVVATDDTCILNAVNDFGGKAVMTSPDHPSGTDRCYEAFCATGSDADVVINIQGDEPFIDPSQIEALKACFDDPDVQIATLVRPFDPSQGYEALSNPNSPKVVRDGAGNALYFSRSVIPYVRGVETLDQWPVSAQFFTHVGIYAFRADVLGQIVKLPQSPLELAEKLEQLRWLEAGYKIRTAITHCQTVGIDTPADLEHAISILNERQNR